MPWRWLIGTATFLLAVSLGVTVRRYLTPDPAPATPEHPPGWWAEADPSPSDSDALGDLAYLAGYEPPIPGATGVVRSTPDRLADGPRLVVSAHRPGAELIDISGERLREWTCALTDLDPDADPTGRPGTWWRRAKLLPDGGVLAILASRAVVRLDRDSNVLWHDLGGYHHDFEFDAEGGLWILHRHVRRRRGGSEWAEDTVRRLDLQTGEVLEELSLHAAIVESEWGADLEPAPDPLHSNAIRLLREGDGPGDSWRPGRFLVSIRELDALAVLDVTERRLTAWLTGAWRRQHDPVPMGDGTVLLFDNQGQGERAARVLRVDVSTGEIGWEWTGGDLARFASPQLGAVQPLPNGNVLVTESTAGRAFEISAEGEVLWEYRNPHRAGEGGELVAALASVERIPPDAL